MVYTAQSQPPQVPRGTSSPWGEGMTDLMSRNGLLQSVLKAGVK